MKEIKKVLVIDNYDSFTYNLVQLVGIMIQKLWKGGVLVFRNDALSISQIEELSPTHIIISPGPCTPKEAGISVEVIKHFSGKIPLLGVCLGHQCIGEAYSAEIIRAKRLMHGKVSLISHTGKGVFTNIPNPFYGMRYHSLAIDIKTLSSEFEITALAEDGEIMGIKHKYYPLEGVQFHPESIGTSLSAWKKRNKPPLDWDFTKDDLPEGVLILRNFLTFY